MRILVIEDDGKVASFIQTGLEQEGYAVDVLHHGNSAGEQARAVDYDAVVLDLMLPGRSGFQVLRDIRARKPSLPVIMLTAKDSLDERVAGLDAGADDYMAKPFALAELSARLRALLRRGTPRESVLRVADLEMDTIRRTVRRAGAAIDLKPKEYALLEFLMRNSDRPITRSLIIEHVWDIHFDSISNVVEVHINSLRNKIDRGFRVQLIHTVRGVGYMLTDCRTVTLPLRARLAVIATIVSGLLLGVLSIVSYNVLARWLDEDVTTQADRADRRPARLSAIRRRRADRGIQRQRHRPGVVRARGHAVLPDLRLRNRRPAGAVAGHGAAWSLADEGGSRACCWRVRCRQTSRRQYGRLRVINSPLTSPAGQATCCRSASRCDRWTRRSSRYRDLLLLLTPLSLVAGGGGLMVVVALCSRAADTRGSRRA